MVVVRKRCNQILSPPPLGRSNHDINLHIHKHQNTQLHNSFRNKKYAITDLIDKDLSLRNDNKDIDDVSVRSLNLNYAKAVAAVPTVSPLELDQMLYKGAHARWDVNDFIIDFEPVNKLQNDVMVTLTTFSTEVNNFVARYCYNESCKQYTHLSGANH